jgi:GGDEF domain-containing protein
MSSLKQSIFWVAFYLIIVVTLAQFDYSSTPIIDFAKYFYLMAIVVIPATVFFPSIAKINFFVPMVIWGCTYLVLAQVLDRSASAPSGSVAIIVLEFVLVEVGAWLGYQLAFGISHAESLMDALALSAFPNDVHDIDLENKRIKLELTRSRRYDRPLGLVVIESESDDRKIARQMLKSVQQDLMSRFTLARIGQIISDRIRQTDLVLRDHHGRFVILCPETDLESAILLGSRVAQDVEERTDFHVLWGVAAFPEDALTFDDLLLKARERLARSMPVEKKHDVEMFESQSEVKL